MQQNMNPAKEDVLYGIHCDVTNCYYNEQKECHAEEIKVGPQFAASTADTNCATFKAR